MANNITLNEGTESSVKTREINSEHVQAVYLNIGTATDNPYNGTIAEVTSVGTIPNIAKIHNAGTIAALPNLPGGSIAVTAGTIASVGTVPGVGSVSSVAQIHNAGTIAALPNIPGGTITALQNGTITSGSIVVTEGTIASVGTVPGVGVVTTVTNLANGTIQNSGTTTGVGVVTTVTNLSNGTIQNSGTTTGVGTVSDIAKIHDAGTIQRIVAGTLTNSGTTTGVGVVSNLTQGSINVTAGTIGAATVNAGTVRNDGRPARQFLTFGTTFGGTGTAAAYATLVAAPGASNYIWVDSLSIKNPYETVECAIGFGTAVDGGSVLEKGVYGTQTGIGISRTFPNPNNGNIANQPLVLFKSGLGTVYANVSYFTAVA